MQKVIIGINAIDFKNPKANHRQKIAIDVLLENKPDNIEVVNFCFADDIIPDYCNELFTQYLNRNSKEEIGNQRPLPYIKEIFDALSVIKDAYIFGYMNSDILLTKDFFRYFEEDADAYVFSRKEITDVDSVKYFNDKRYKFVWGGDTHAGADAFFFRREFWIEHRDLFHSDLILGETEWDTVYRHMILRKADKYTHERALLHVYHDAKWNVNSIGGKNNTKIWEYVRDNT